MPDVLPAAQPQLKVKRGILVVASPDSLSEAAFSIPAIRALHEQNTIVIVADTNTSFFWRHVPEVNRVIDCAPGDSSRKIARALADSGISFDASISWEDSSIARSFAKFGISQRFGDASISHAKTLTDPVETPQSKGPIDHRVKFYLHFVETLGLSPFQAKFFASPPRPEEPESPILALVPGSDFGPAAEWPLERYLELAKQLPEDLEVVILPSPGRPGPAASLGRSLSKPVHDVNGGELIEFLGTCQALVGNDGSLPHLASFVGTPSVVLFGPNEPRWRRPLGKIHRIVREHVPCSGCLLHKCPLDHRCMNEIEVAHVLPRVEALLIPSGVNPS